MIVLAIIYEIFDISINRHEGIYQTRYVPLNRSWPNHDGQGPTEMLTKSQERT